MGQDGAELRFAPSWPIDNLSVRGPRVDSASNRNEYQESFLVGKSGRCAGLTTLPPSCSDCLEIREPQPPGTLWVCSGIALPLHIFTVYA
jgi:hypothetical protein